MRDGNQALIEPMDSVRKMKMFKMLVNGKMVANKGFDTTENETSKIWATDLHPPT